MPQVEQPQEELDKDSRKRLDKLAKEWDKTPSGYSFDSADLRLLLEYHTPLQALIRHIVATAPYPLLSGQHSAADIEPAAPAAHAQNTQAQQEAVQAFEQTKNELIQTQAELAQAQFDLKQLQQTAQQTQADLKACNTQVEKLLKAEGRYKQEIKALKDKSKQLQAELLSAQSRSSAIPELAFLRSDLQLARAMGLDKLPTDDTQALIQTVAVLAQIDNLKRLWEVLKDRCETENRPASAAENTLLQAALNWHNHNWRSLPYRLITAAPASRYDYETQSRSRHVTKGETVATMHLPGIADGSGKALCKALVQTK